MTAGDAVRDDEGGEAGRRALLRSARVVSIGTLGSRLLGLVRDQALAALFPAGVTDAFWVAFKLPNLLRSVLAEGAMNSAVVPVLAEVRARAGEGEAKAFFAKIRGLSLLVLLGVTGACMAFAPQIVDLFAPGQHARPGQFERTVTLTRWVFPYIVFMGSTALGMAALNTHRRFVATSFAPALLNVGFLTSMFALPAFFVARGEDPALALVVGALAGGVMQVAAQLPSLRAIGYLGAPRLDLGDAHVRRALARLGPITVGFGIYYVDTLVGTRFLSQTGEGSQSWFSFAQRLCDFPQGVFSLALTAASLPSMSALAARGQHADLGRTFAYAMRLSLFVSVPISVLFVAVGEPIVVALFARGHFDRASAHETARALAAQGAGVWAFAAVRQLLPMFYATGNTRIPVVVSALDFLAFVALAAGLTPSFGHVGVSIAVTGSTVVQMALLWWLLGRKLPDLGGAQIARSAAVTAASALVGGAGAWGAARAAEALLGEGPVARLAPCVAALVAFGVLFVASAWAMRSEELSILGGGLTRRLQRRPR